MIIKPILFKHLAQRLVINLDFLLNIDNPYFKGMVNLICLPELQLNKANTSDTEAHFLDLHLFLTVLFPPKFMISAMTIYIVNFPFG